MNIFICSYEPWSFKNWRPAFPSQNPAVSKISKVVTRKKQLIDYRVIDGLRQAARDAL